MALSFAQSTQMLAFLVLDWCRLANLIRPLTMNARPESDVSLATKLARSQIGLGLLNGNQQALARIIDASHFFNEDPSFNNRDILMVTRLGQTVLRGLRQNLDIQGSLGLFASHKRSHDNDGFEDEHDTKRSRKNR